MPLYEYQCEKCRNRFEKIQKFTDPAPDACPACGEGPVKRLPSSPAIQFKGTGWYITDYAKKSSTDAGRAGSSEKTDTGSSSKSDSGTSTASDSGSSSGGSSPAPAAAKAAKSE